jgi:hypothetical protein
MPQIEQYKKLFNQKRICTPVVALKIFLSYHKKNEEKKEILIKVTIVSGRKIHQLFNRHTPSCGTHQLSLEYMRFNCF